MNRPSPLVAALATGVLLAGVATAPTASAAGTVAPKASSATPEPFTFVPENVRSIAFAISTQLSEGTTYTWTDKVPDQEVFSSFISITTSSSFQQLGPQQPNAVSASLTMETVDPSHIVGTFSGEWMEMADLGLPAMVVEHLTFDLIADPA